MTKYILELEPLLFQIYVNDLQISSGILHSILFAPMILTFFTQTRTSLSETVNKELIHFSEWFKANKLSLNITKTK